MFFPVMRFRAASALLGGWLAAFLASEGARADDKDRCATAAEQAQSLRQAGKLREAREQLVACARDTCPPVVRPFCARWLLEVEAALPSIVFRAHDARGQDVVGVRVLVDRVPLMERLEGVSVPLDPGSHRVRFEARGGAVVESDVLIAQGEKNRSLIGSFPIALTPDGVLDERPAAQRRTRTAAYVVGGVGALALASFLYFDLTSWGEYRNLRDTCAPTRSCASSDVDSVKVKIGLSAASLGMSAIALGLATWLFLMPSATASRTSEWFLRARLRSGTVGLGAVF